MRKPLTLTTTPSIRFHITDADGQDIAQMALMPEDQPNGEALVHAFNVHEDLVRLLEKAYAIIGQLCEHPERASDIASSGNTGHLRETLRAQLAEARSA